MTKFFERKSFSRVGRLISLFRVALPYESSETIEPQSTNHNRKLHLLNKHGFFSFPLRFAVYASESERVRGKETETEAQLIARLPRLQLSMKSAP